MPDLLPVQRPRSAVGQRDAGGLTYSRRMTKALRSLEERTLVRMANVQAEGLVQGEKLREIDHLAREAMTSQAMLYQWANTLSQGDLLLADELRPFASIARVGKCELINNTVDSFCRESRRR